MDKDLETKIKNIKTKSKWGCFAWVAILLFGPVILFIYEMNFKETTLVISHSPSNLHTIKVVEKGQPAWFGPSTVRIKYGWKHIDQTIYNDGKKLDSNVVVRWKNDDEALILIDGEEQAQEVIKFDGKASNPFQTRDFEVELGSFTFKTSESPNLKNIIELREISKSKGSSSFSTVKIYYGKRGSVLEKFKEYIPQDMYVPDDFQVEWINDEQARIKIMRESENGEARNVDLIDIDIDSNL